MAEEIGSTSNKSYRENDNLKLAADSFTEECTFWMVFDENLLEQARTQWQFGDWVRLASISRESLQHHPERAKLAVLVAAGHGQCGDSVKLKQFIALASDWGCPKKLISQTLISGVQNSLGRAALAVNQFDRAQSLFEQSIKTGMPSADLKLLSDARGRQQRHLLGIKDTDS